MHGSRHCVRPGCGAIAEATLTYHYASRTAWLDELDGQPDPSSYELCGQHADRFTVPLGWNREDRRPNGDPIPHPVPTREELFDIPLAV
jgi:hypothetical protein